MKFSSDYCDFIKFTLKANLANKEFDSFFSSSVKSSEENDEERSISASSILSRYFQVLFNPVFPRKLDPIEKTLPC